MRRINLQSSPPGSVEVPGNFSKKAKVSAGKFEGRAGLTFC